jgi:uncharacterized protein (DUF924 family)/Ran GTPase-activating protein (RanGAP) involved in mRNA processing and transport
MDPDPNNDPLKQQVLDFWFGTDARVRAERWFSGTPEIDALVRELFLGTFERAAAGELEAWKETASGAVALMVVLDQFPRHLFRGDPRMFATDGPALAAARIALAGELEPAFLAAVWLCLTHAEDKELVAEAVAGFEALLRSPEARSDRKHYKRMLVSTRRHLRVLERFGRYPHRNGLLGRETRPEEATYLESETSRFARSVLPHPPASSGPRLKILVLHSFRQSGARLASRLRKLEAAVGDIAELVFVDAPHPYTPDDNERAMLADDFGAVPDFAHQRCWWHADDTQQVYTGWEESMRVLDAHLPADGVLGFSQGGAVAGLFAALRTDKLRFAVCISGFPSRAEAHRMLTVPSGIDLPSLHVYGEQDVLMNRERTLQLAGCFVEPQLVSHPGGHFFPEMWPTDAIRAFLLQFIEAPAPAVQPALQWEPDLPLAEVASRLPPSREALADLLVQARALRVRPRRLTDLLAPQPGDLAHRIWLAVWQRDPELVREALASEDDFRQLVRLALVAAADAPADEEILAAIAGRFVAQIVRDEENGAMSLAAEATPRTGSGTDRFTALGRRVSLLLCPDKPHPTAYAEARRRLVALSRRVRQARQRARKIRREVMPSVEVSREVTRPRPVPVVPCPPEELAPLLDFLGQQKPAVVPQRFPRGTLMPDGRLDLCKQVVGPDGIGPLLGALAGNTHVDRLLLGNNVVGSQGAAHIASFIRSGQSRVRVWYIAGNEIDPQGLQPICEAMAQAPEVQGLWLKRNPIGPEGARPLAELLRTDPPIQTLDLVNTGVLDEGARLVLEALEHNTHLRHLYLGTDGLTAESGRLLGRYLAAHDRLESLYVDCNRLGDEGAAALAEGLRHSRRLRRLSLASNRIGPDGARALADALREHPSLVLLNLGWTRATNAVHEEGNRLGDAGCEALAELLRHNRVLRVLDVSHNAITQRGLDVLREALTDNVTLVSLRHPQYGKATNPDSIARLRGLVERNRRDAGLDEDAIEAIRTPLPTREVLSVYRTAPMG